MEGKGFLVAAGIFSCSGLDEQFHFFRIIIVTLSCVPNIS